MKRKINERLQKTLADRFKFREQGAQISFPEHNPLPKRKEELTKKQKKVAGLLKYKEKMRTAVPKKRFVGWEYKDRFSYRKDI